MYFIIYNLFIIYLYICNSYTLIFSLFQQVLMVHVFSEFYIFISLIDIFYIFVIFPPSHFYKDVFYIFRSFWVLERALWGQKYPKYRLEKNNLFIMLNKHILHFSFFPPFSFPTSLDILNWQTPKAFPQTFASRE